MSLTSSGLWNGEGVSQRTVAANGFGLGRTVEIACSAEPIEIDLRAK